MKIKILLLASNPKNTSSLRLSEEFRDIKESIKLSENSHDFDVFEGYAVRAKDLRRLILEKSPHIIHYSGHGEDEGILLENNQGNTNPIEGYVLEELFSLFDSINCIILNSCYSVKQANSLRKVVPYIIGMQKSIKDQSAIYFSTGFYDAIASKRTIEDAFKFGVNAIRLHRNDGVARSIILEEKGQIPEANIPILIKGSIQRDLPKTLLKNNNVEDTKLHIGNANSPKSFGKTIIKWFVSILILLFFLFVLYFIYSNASLENEHRYNPNLENKYPNTPNLGNTNQDLTPEQKKLMKEILDDVDKAAMKTIEKI